MINCQSGLIADVREMQYVHFLMASFKGTLYAGTCEAGKDETGHVYRYNDANKWIDCGSPDSRIVSWLLQYLMVNYMPEQLNTVLPVRHNLNLKTLIQVVVSFVMMETKTG